MQLTWLRILSAMGSDRRYGERFIETKAAVSLSNYNSMSNYNFTLCLIIILLDLMDEQYNKNCGRFFNFMSAAACFPFYAHRNMIENNSLITIEENVLCYSYSLYAFEMLKVVANRVRYYREGSKISTNQKRESSVFSLLIG